MSSSCLAWTSQLFHSCHLLCKKQQSQSSCPQSSPRSMGEDPLAKLSLAPCMAPSNIRINKSLRAATHPLSMAIARIEGEARCVVPCNSA